MTRQVCFFGALLSIFAVVFVWSAIKPHDFFTWLLEVMPVIIALPILFFTHQKFPLTRLLYILILIHAIILMIGGHYTYALVPINELPVFSWLKETFDLDRNYYDRIGHFAQGFVPAIIAREILIRNFVVKTGAWLFFVVCCICLSISACYEFVEWWVAVAAGGAAEDFLGTQGDIWDTQWDMLLALIGAIFAQVLLGHLHDKQLLNLQSQLEP
jgi:putative membrane protein